ncbi:hypothetical protein GHT06_008765 [Daphnia sinensis]|uniref:DUF5641 domain-containing protein n=1 Tax=Daphnia sinensis TaxID=1820382 RepID=A0AAD5LVW6_9CRUS|nr:hypothetical protein GHT06_008765 [Daphnia sinensis]
MVTHLKSMQAVINSRPLAWDVDSPNDSAFYVTPSDLLIGRRAVAFPSSVDLNNFDWNEDLGKLSKRLPHQKQVFDRAWKSWTNCYQRDLRNFAHRDRPGSTQPIQVGQMVMIRDDLLSRFKWKVGLVTNLHVGRDERVRMVDLRLPSGNSTTRAIQSLYSLENDVLPAESQTLSDSPCSQRKLRFESPSEGNSRGECKEMEVEDGNAASTKVGNNNPNLDVTRSLRSGRPHCLKPYL